MHDPHQVHPITTIIARQTPPNTPPMMGARGIEGCEEDELLDSVVKLGVGEAPPEYIVVVTIVSSSGAASRPSMSFGDLDGTSSRGERRIMMGVTGIMVIWSLYSVVSCVGKGKFRKEN